MRVTLLNGVKQFFAFSIGASVAGTAVGAVWNAQCYNNPNVYQYPTHRPWDNNWDRREPTSLVRRSRKENRNEPPNCSQEELDKKTATAKRTIVLIRHGQYNLDGLTDMEMKLTEVGIEQAKCISGRLKELDISINRLVSSDMQRAKETAQIIAEELTSEKTEVNVVCDPLLREGVPALPEPPLENVNWGVPISEVYQDGVRIEAAFRKYVHRAHPSQKEDSVDIIVCHGNVIRYFVCRALQFPGEAWLRLQVDNASLTTISVLPEGDVIVQNIGDAGHIPVEKVTVT